MLKIYLSTCILQDSSWPVLFHGLAIIAASLSVIRGVATIEPVNKVIVPILLAIVVFSFYWALFLPYAADGIIHMFKPHWGMRIDCDLGVHLLVILVLLIVSLQQV